jgi:hypothetical protein
LRHGDNVRKEQNPQGILLVSCAQMLPGGVPAISRKSLLVMPLRVCANANVGRACKAVTAAFLQHECLPIPLVLSRCFLCLADSRQPTPVIPVLNWSLWLPWLRKGMLFIPNALTTSKPCVAKRSKNYALSERI